MVLACQNISKAYGITEILNNINFHIEEKEKLMVTLSSIVGWRLIPLRC